MRDQLAGWVTAFLNHHKRINHSKKTILGYREVLNRLLNFLDNSALSLSTVNAFNDHLINLGTWSPSGRKNNLKVIKSFVNWLYNNGLIAERWAGKIEMPKVPMRFVELPNIEEAEKIIIKGTEIHFSRKGFKGDNSINANRKTATRIFLNILLDTGLRYSKLANVKKDQVYVNCAEPYLVAERKGGGDQIVNIIREDDIRGIKKMLKISQNERLFSVTEEHCNECLKRGSKLLNYPKITCHDLRRIGATNINDNKDIEAAREFLDHKDIRTTQNYIIHSRRKIREIISLYHDRNRQARTSEEIKKQMEEALIKLNGGKLIGEKVMILVDKTNPQTWIFKLASSLET